MTRPIGAVTALSLLAALALLAGCSNDGGVLARVGDRTITVGQFNQAAAATAGRTVLPPDSAKRMLLNDMIRRELLVVAARTNPSIQDSLVRLRRELVEEQELSRALVNQLVPAPIAVSDAEVQRLYQQRALESHAQIVFTPDEATARAALAAIRHGEDFGAVAQRFDISGSLPPGGDLGFIAPGGLISPIDEILRDSPVGTITGPVEAAGQGWFIIKVLERREHVQPPLALEAPRLKNLLEQRKNRALLIRGQDALLRAYDVRTSLPGIRVLYERVGPSQLVRQMGGEPPPAPMTPEQADLVLAEWDGGPDARGAYTLGMAQHDLERGLGQRIDASHLMSYEQWVKVMALQKVAMLEARRRRLDQDFSVADRIHGTVDDYVAESVFNVEVEQKSEPTFEDVNAAYSMALPALAMLKAARVEHLTFHDSAAAARAIVTLQGVPSISGAVVLSSPGMRVKNEWIQFPNNDPMWSSLRPAFTREPLGTLIGPIPLATGWRIVQLLDRNIVAPRLDELPPEARQQVIQQARQSARERRLLFYTDSLRRAVPVIVDESRFQKLRWPAPAGIESLTG